MKLWKIIFSFKNIRIINYAFTLFVLFKNIPFVSDKSTLYIADYIFLSILLIAYILLNKFNIRLNDSYLSLLDFVIIICYFKFNLSITVWFLLICYIFISLIEYKYYRNLNILTENDYIFNVSLMITGTYLSHVSLKAIDSIYALSNYNIILILIFSINFLIFNYVLFCLDNSIQKNKLILITLEDGLYYVVFNSFLCTLIAIVSIYLAEFLNYIPIVIIIFILIFVSFALNNLDRLKTVNDNLKSISKYSSFIISKNDFKTKLYAVIKTIENIVPFIYCGIYFFRDNHDCIYPVCYQSSMITSTEEIKFPYSPSSENFRNILSSEPLYSRTPLNSDWIPITKKLNKEVKGIIVIPIKSSDKPLGFIFLALPKHKDIDDKLELLSILGSHIALINENISTIMRSNYLPYKNFDGLSKLIDYNIKFKLLFTLGILEVKNSHEIINDYNIDFYESLKLDLVKQIYKYVSSNDIVMSFEKDNIFFVFNLLDDVNSIYKLKQLCQLFKTFKFSSFVINLDFTFSTSEYPLEGSNKEEIFDTAYKKLYNKKNI